MSKRAEKIYSLSVLPCDTSDALQKARREAMSKEMSNEIKKQHSNWGWYKPPIGKRIYWANLEEFKPCLWHRIIAKLKGLHLSIIMEGE